MKRIVRWLRLTVAATAIAVTAVTVFAVVAPRLVPVQLLYVRSGSMEPTLGVGALVAARPADAADLAVGDVVVFSPEGKDNLVMHRIVRSEQTPQGPMFVTKGDANDADDPWRIPATGTGWRVERAVPKVGYALGFARDPRANLALLSIAGAWFVISALRRIWRPEEAVAV